MTAILGISAFYHDSAAALVVDGEIVEYRVAVHVSSLIDEQYEHHVPGTWPNFAEVLDF